MQKKLTIYNSGRKVDRCPLFITLANFLTFEIVSKQKVTP